MKSMRPILALLVVAFCLVGAASAAAVTLPPGFQAEEVLQVNEPGFEHTTNFKFAPNGDIWVATRGGKILDFPPGASHVSEATIFANLAKQTFDWGDHGILGLALDPKFEEGRPYVYALYSYNHELGAPAGEMPKWPSATTTGVSAFEGDECPEENKCVVSGRLVRLTDVGGHAEKEEPSGEPKEKVLLEGWCQQSSSHSIGDLSFGPEGALYVSGGEGAIYTDSDYGQYENLCGDPPGPKGTNLEVPDAEGGSLRSQSLLRPDGKVLLSGTLDRIDPDTGKGWPTNPDAASSNENAQRIVGFGFRNPFRFVVSPRLGDIFVGNVGANKWEEIDRVPIGGPLYNSGWPCYEGPELEQEFAFLELNACKRLTQAETAPPFFYYSHFEPVVPGDECSHESGSAISGEAFYEGSTYPAEYDNALFFSDSVRGCIYVMLADEDGEPDPAIVRPFLSSEVSDYPGVDIEQGPEGSIYYTTLDDGMLSKIVYEPEAVTARLTTTGHPYGDVPLAVRFDASGSTGPSADILKYEWDVQGEGTYSAPSSSPFKEVTYTNGTENVSVAVRVKDQTTGKTSIARLTVYPGDSPPKLTLLYPEPTLTWGVGNPIFFEGYAESQEEGHEGDPMPEEDSYWKVRLLHCPFGPSDCHEHPISVFPGVKGGTVGAPDHSYPSYVNFIFSATDSRGLSAETSRKVKARPVPLQIHSEPPGIDIGVGESSLTAPAEYIAIEGSRTTVAAPAEAVVGGVKYAFERWSDGGDRVHEVSSTEPGTYTAIYRTLEVAPPSPPGGGGGSGGGGGNPPGPEAPRVTVAAKPTLKGHPAKQTRLRTAKFVFGGSPGTRFSCKLDRGKAASCRSPRIYRRLKAGRHTVRIYATKGSAGQSAATVFSWKILPSA